MVVRDVPKFERKNAHVYCQNEQFHFFFQIYIDVFVRFSTGKRAYNVAT